MISRQNLTGIGDIVGKVVGFAIGYPIGAYLGIIGAGKMFMPGGSKLISLICALVAFVVLPIIADPLRLNQYPQALSVFFVALFPVASLTGYVLGVKKQHRAGKKRNK